MRPLPARLAAARPATAGARYGAAVLAAAAGAGVTLALRELLHPHYVFVSLGCVFLAAWYGGLRPGLLATGLSLLAVNFFFMRPYGAFGMAGAPDLVLLGMFAALGVAASVLAGRFHAARAATGEHAAELERLAGQLQDQAVELEQQTEEAQSLNVELEQEVEESHRLRMELEAANAQLRAAAAESGASRERLGRILETMAEGVALVGADGRFTYCNPRGAAILGVPAERVVGRRFDDPAFGAGSELPIGEVLRTGEPVHGAEVTAEEPGGRRLFLRVSAAPLRGGGGEVAGVVATFDDVTEGHEARAHAAESEERFRILADVAPVLIWMAGTDALCTFFNQPWLDFTGRTLEQELGNGWAEGVHPDDYQRCLTVYFSSFEARRPYRMDYRLRRADGEYRWLLDTGVPRYLPDGTFAGFVGTCIDITEHREAEEQLRFLADAGSLLASSLDYEETLRRVCRLTVPVLADLCVLDLLEDGRLRRVEVVHADPEMAEAARRLRSFAPSPDSAHPVAEVLRTGTARVENEVSVAYLHPAVVDPEHREVVRRLGITAYMAVPLVAGGRVMGSLLLCAAGSGRRYGAAERVRAEELARRAALAIENARLYERAVEANRAKSDFLAVMSHELRTPLNAILGYTDLLLMGLPVALPPELQPQMERVRVAARHLLELIEEILTFSRLEAGQEELHPERLEVAAVAAEALALVEPQAAERGIGLRADPVPEGLVVVADRRKVKQVLVNLLGNAVKFTERGEASLSVEVRPGALVFRVADTGIGIPPEQLERIFEPFWQADQGLMRERGGSGLGLSVARRLARLMGGDVTVESTPGEGSVFTFWVPR